MKKFFIIFLVLVIMLGMFNVVVAEDNYRDKIINKLDEIQSNIEDKNTDAAKANLMDLREYVYGYARELADHGEYNEQILNIIAFAAKAIEENNIEYIAEARKILDIIGKESIIEEQNNHS